ncbi:Replication initiation and membrane attachment protein [Bacillus lacus]|uniref:Replication initiation and membrane attachment protein n=1 Tax=Metabacillus lacus TaxID=1983721 RepID=A0A7X2IXR8_9BACI|nr:replication initiation and membrane attachment family protein [Metabacillus lacus]MRX71776.1 Replication initiation and membrane attachment protein [Metabacillus lacus]
MVQHWKEIIPVDRYIVKCNGLLHEYDRKIITLLYQPLIGAKSYSLFMTLWSELEQNRLWGEETAHHSLMAIMQNSLKEIYEERIKLEGIGLLRTFLKEEGEDKLYIYELQPPLDPNDFFEDGMLNIYLYNRLGKSKYVKLKKFFCDRELIGEAKNVTRSFDDVFTSIKPSELLTSVEASESAGQGLIKREDASSPHIEDDVFDFDLFYAGLSDAIIPKSSITPKVKETIKKLAYLYGIDPISMKNVIMNSMDADDSIVIEELRKSARTWYQFEHGEKLPSLAEKTQPAAKRKVSNPSTQEEEMAYQLETISPRQFLKDVAGGIEPSAGDLQIIEETMFRQKLLPGVVNVLIYYVMLKTDMKLTKTYVQKIASHWARKKITTVPEAMSLAKQEHKQYQEWASGKKNSRKAAPIRKEKLPSWLKAGGEEGQPAAEQKAVPGDKGNDLDDIINSYLTEK